MKQAFDKLIRALDIAKKRISKLEDRSVHINSNTKSRQERENRPEQSIQELWYDRKWFHTCIIRAPETEENGAEEIVEEIIVGNFSKFIKAIQLQMQEAKRTPSRINASPLK